METKYSDASINFGISYNFTEYAYSDECDNKDDIMEEFESIINENVINFLSESDEIEIVDNDSHSSIVVLPHVSPYVLCTFLFRFNINANYKPGVLMSIIDTLDDNSGSIILNEVYQNRAIESIEITGAISGNI